MIQAFAAEEGLSLVGTPEQRQRLFEAQATKGYVWGLFSDNLLHSISQYNARYGATAQMGGCLHSTSLSQARFISCGEKNPDRGQREATSDRSVDSLYERGC